MRVLLTLNNKPLITFQSAIAMVTRQDCQIRFLSKGESLSYVYVHIMPRIAKKKFSKESNNLVYILFGRLANNYMDPH